MTVTPSGAIVGSWMETRKGRTFEAYRGIRYAEPPVGELRFQPPRPILEYKTVVNASEEGPSCPLLAPGFFMSEDCLTINVYTPSNNVSEPLPVIFFIHPGGFYSMTGRSDVSGPHYLLDRDVVLVTINYRLGSLGFISTGDELAPGNLGLKDQVVALKWVQRNIRSFGVNPNLVTLTGDSAGSFSVILHMISPMSQGLFHRGIAMSGSPIQKVPSEHYQYYLAVRQAEILGCPTNNSRVIMDCLKTKPWQELGDSYVKFFEFGFDPVGIWWPVVELDFGQERFLVEEPMESIRAGRFQQVPLILGQTEYEFYWFAFTALKNQTLLDRMNDEWETVAPISFLLPEVNRDEVVEILRQKYLNDRPLADDKQSERGLGLLYADSIIGFTVGRLANFMCRYSKQPVYNYQFTYVGNQSHFLNPDTGKPIGAVHHDDLMYLLSMRYQFQDITTDGPDAPQVDRMTALWYNFARHGDPNTRGDLPELESLSWPVMTPEERKYVKIDREFSIHSKLNEDRYKLWEELYPVQY